MLIIIIQKHYFSVLTFYEKQQKSIFLNNYCILLFYVQHVLHEGNTLHTNRLFTMLPDVTKGFEVNNFIKTLFFCANFLRKMIKIKISDQLLYFVILCTIFQTYVKRICTQTDF
jgi:hypothetical protein